MKNYFNLHYILKTKTTPYSRIKMIKKIIQNKIQTNSNNNQMKKNLTNNLSKNLWISWSGLLEILIKIHIEKFNQISLWLW